MSKEAFFRIGVMIALRSPEGNEPLERELLTILVKIGVKTGRCCFTDHVGIGSKEQLLEGHFYDNLMQSIFSNKLELT